METPDSVLKFWLDDTGPSGWYTSDPAIDAAIRDRFLSTWEEARKDGHLGWQATPRGTLALLVLLDQFPRNMFRGDGRSYASDAAARKIAKRAIARGWDRRIAEPARQFFYMPLMHSECLEDQERCVRLIHDRMPAKGAANLLHAKAHREVIRRFGRFPHRNGEMNRRSTALEAAFLDEGGYGAVVRGLQAA